VYQVGMNNVEPEEKSVEMPSSQGRHEATGSAIRDKKLISIVIPAYNEEGCVEEMASRLKKIFAANQRYDFEVIWVENGSLDRTYEKILLVRKCEPRFKMLRLARNFRTDGGITAGLSVAKGDAAVLMAADLQDPPEFINIMIAKWEEGYENIYQIVSKRKGVPFLRRMNSQLFYWFVGKLTDKLIPPNVSDFRLVDRKVYQVVNSMQERNRFMRGLFAWSGFKVLGIECEREERFSGVSNAATMRMIGLALKGIFAHSYVPLKMILGTGLLLSFLSFGLLFFYVVRTLGWGVPFPGFGSIICVMLLMFGFLFTMLGVIGEYIGLIYEEVKQRPNFIIQERVGI
jgi:glycosyltransferase involved in cell wall biosynthesis